MTTVMMVVMMSHSFYLFQDSLYNAGYEMKV